MDMLVNCIAYAVLLSSACALNGNETAVRRVLHVYSVPGYDVEEVATAVEQTIDSSGSHRHNLTVEFEEVEDIGCDTLSSRRNLMLQQPPPLAVLDGACPRVSEAIAEVSSTWNIPHISYTPYPYEYFTSEQADAFRNLFTLYPSQQHLGQYIAALLQYFNWTQVSVVYQQDYSQIVNGMNRVVNSSNITVVQSVSYVEDMSINDLFGEAHILVIVANSNVTQSILCKAGEDGFVYPGYTFITQHWFGNGWWLAESDQCTVLDLISALNNSLSVALQPKQFCIEETDNVVMNPFLVYAHEAAHVLTKALSDPVDNALMEVQQQLTTSCNETNRMRAADKMVVYQYREVQGEIETRTVAVINSSFEFIFEFNESVATLWPDGVPPDGRPVSAVSTYHIAVVIVFYTISLLGIAFAIVCLAFNIIFRNRKVVRLSSPKLNYLIIAGALMLYITLFLVVYPNNTSNLLAVEVLCNIVHASGVGVSLCVGTIQGKMFRIFHIFRNPSPAKKKIKDWHIAAYVGILVLYDILAYIFIVGVPGIHPKPVLIPDAEKASTKNELQVEVRYFTYACVSSSLSFSIVRSILLFGHRYILDFVSVVLAIISSRKINVEVMNDAKYVLAIVFLHFINITTFNVVALVFRTYPNVFAVAGNLSVLEPPTDILLLTFIPKMVSLYKDPHGEKIFSNISPRENMKTSAGRSTSGTDDNTELGALSTTEH